jgi:hypothetical protein
MGAYASGFTTDLLYTILSASNAGLKHSKILKDEFSTEINLSKQR